jgi:hypothetical protein
MQWSEAMALLNEGNARTVLFGLAKGNLSFSQWIFEQAGRDLSGFLSALLLGATAFALWTRRSGGSASRPGTECEDPGPRLVLVAGLGCAIPLLAWPLAWVHYFVLTAPLALVALRPRAGAIARTLWIERGLAILALIMLSASNLYGILTSEPQELMILGQSLFSGATLILIALSLWALTRGEARSTA